ncbi:MAG: TRAP transporter substrate-binding protein DctP [Desulfovibrionaceae bacterium]|nr:TRAP transporter substrate-binding protein DctP [Desulfovibrionaceae bacterium]
MKNRVIRCLMALALGVAAASPAMAAPEYILSLNLSIAPIHNRWNKALKPWADEIEKRSGGRVVIEPYFAQAISPQAEVVESVRSGLADIGEATFTVGGLGRYPFHEQLLNLVKPSNCTVDPVTLVSGLHKAFPEQAAADTKGTRLLFLEGHSVGMLIGTRDKPITKLEDLKGMKIGVGGGGIRVERMKKLGATVVGVTISDMYMSLEKGVIDGAVVDGDVLISRKIGDIIKHMTLVNMGGSVFYCVMNPQSYENLPPDLRQVIDEVSAEYAPQVMKEFWDTMQYASLEKWMKEQGGKVYMLSAEDYAKADELVEPTYAEWVEFSKSKGLPAEDILAKFRELEADCMKPWADSPAAALVSR